MSNVETRPIKKMKVKVFPNLEETCSALAEMIMDLSQESIQQKKPFSLVLSGGKTPRPFYHLLGKQYAEKIQWNDVHLFWGDERWVPFHHLVSPIMSDLAGSSGAVPFLSEPVMVLCVPQGMAM